MKYDSERDLKDIGASKIQVYFLSKMKYAKINSDINGNVKKGVMFCTYSSLIGESSAGQGKYKTRLKQLLNWCGDDFDGPVSFVLYDLYYRFVYKAEIYILFRAMVFALSTRIL